MLERDELEAVFGNELPDALRRQWTLRAEPPTGFAERDELC
jgi:hypothetical protein